MDFVEVLKIYLGDERHDSESIDLKGNEAQSVLQYMQKVCLKYIITEVHTKTLTTQSYTKTTSDGRYLPKTSVITNCTGENSSMQSLLYLDTQANFPGHHLLKVRLV